MTILLAGDDPVLATLREQYAAASVAGRELTGAGFFTRFSIPEEAPRLANPRRIEIDDVHADIKKHKHGAGFILSIENGTIDTLEGFTYSREWPENAELMRICYTSRKHPDRSISELVETRERDFEYLYQNWKAAL